MRANLCLRSRPLCGARNGASPAQRHGSRRRKPAQHAAPPKEPAPPPSVTVIGARDAHGVLGRDVRSPPDENMGRIVDVIVDRAGAVRAAVIDFGGFLGVGSRKIVVDWNALHFGTHRQQERQHHAGTDQGAGDGGARIQGGHADRRARRVRQPAAVAIRPPDDFGDGTYWRARPIQPIDRIDDDRRDRPIGADGRPPSPQPEARGPPPSPSRQSLRGLDWFIFFLADVQTGFGPFVAVYLTTQKWTQVEIGFVLSIGGIVALIGQMPGGAIVDAARSERLVAGLAVATIGVSALGYAAWPIFPVVVAAATLHAAASCVLGPAIAAISLGLVGPLAIGERLGRNARYASLGNGVAAAVMGTCGYLLSSRRCFSSPSCWRFRPCSRCAHPRARNRRRAGAWRGGARGARRRRNQRAAI